MKRRMAQDSAVTTSQARERVIVIAGACALVAFRAIVFVWWEQSHFDADQAIVGLMAKHLIEGRAFPLFFYGQQYLLGVEAWLIAPFFLVGGVSVATLKLPLLGLNLVIIVLLIVGLERFMGLRPWLAGVAALFLVLPAPSAASRLVQANGCNIEPFLYVLLIWYLRTRPLWLGLVLGLGALNREFTLYGFAALLAVELWQGRLLVPGRLRSLTLTVIVALGVWQGVQELIPYASPRGPGSRSAEIGGLTHAAEVQQRVCWNPQELPQRLAALAGFQLPELFGAQRQPLLRVGIVSSTYQGVDGLWALLVAALALAAGRSVWLTRRGPPRVMAGALGFGVYLFLTGAQSVAVYGLTCGQRSHLTMRYMLLGLLTPVGIAACYFAVERSPYLLRGFVSVVALCTIVAAASHFALLLEYSSDPPPSDYRLLTDYLERQGVRYGRAAFWDAYAVTFLSNERVMLGSTDLVRVDEYVRQFEQNRATAISVSSSRCDGPQVARWWVCPVGDP
jgi:hypothetical protein